MFNFKSKHTRVLENALYQLHKELFLLIRRAGITPEEHAKELANENTTKEFNEFLYSVGITLTSEALKVIKDPKDIQKVMNTRIKLNESRDEERKLREDHTH